MSVTAIIVAAGKGERLGGDVPKQFRLLGGKPVLRWAAEALADHPAVTGLRIVIGDGQEAPARAALDGLEAEFVNGGATRAESVRAGLAGVASKAVLVHDAARPFCPAAVIDRLVAALENNDGAVPVLGVVDTLALFNSDFGDIVDRSELVAIQTPQAARTEALVTAYAQWSGDAPSDESTVLRAAGLKVAAVEGSADLHKITTAEDLARAERWLAGQWISRTGIGFDVHAFGGPGPLMLGGIEIAHDRGLAGHSDADVVLHALTDAVLGAASLGDIGDHFPPTDARWKDASSDRFLAHALALVRAEGAIVDHLDCTIICEAPRVGPYRAEMRARIAAICNLPLARVSVKATTTERLGFTGRGEGIAAQALATLRSRA
ncbi:MAG: bifunctional 2-C-methyl-D-erythritol 4-phosphate cytidylyltransferase/2-C-methyl-D-erythritol 2,4-cyclodiphosphate synthase [Sphingomicrobium sp.]